MLAIFGVIWVMSWYRWGYFKFFELFNNIDDLFDKEIRSSVEQDILRSMKLATNNKYIFLVFVFFEILFIICIFFWFRHSDSNIMKPFLNYEWFLGTKSEIIFKIISIYLISIAVAFLVANTGWAMLVYAFQIFKIIGKILIIKNLLS